MRSIMKCIAPKSNAPILCCDEGDVGLAEVLSRSFSFFVPHLESFQLQEISPLVEEEHFDCAAVHVTVDNTPAQTCSYLPRARQTSTNQVKCHFPAIFLHQMIEHGLGRVKHEWWCRLRGRVSVFLGVRLTTLYCLLVDLRSPSSFLPHVP